MAPPATTWKEVGIGPLRLLQNNTTKSYRIVQRRESTPHGAGTKLILNVGLVCGKVDREAEKYVRVATVSGGAGDGEGKGGGGVVMYLFKVKSVDVGDELEKHLGEALKSGSKEGEDKAGDGGEKKEEEQKEEGK